MSLTIHKNPLGITLSGNPAHVDVSSNTIIISNHKIHCRIKQSGIIVGEDALPVINNAVSFDISDLLKKKKILDINIFDLFDKTIKKIDGLFEKFNLDIFETYNGDGIEHNTIYLGSFKVLQAGFSTIFLKNYDAANKSFYNNFLLEDKKFLTWASKKTLTWNQHDLLFFISTKPSTINYHARFTLYFDDASTTNVDTEKILLLFPTITYFSTSLLTHSLLSYETDNKLVKYDVVMNDDNEIAQSEVKTYYVDRTFYNQQRQFIFKNSIGGYDVIMLKGITDSTDEIQRTVGFFQTEDIITHSDFKESYSANSGFLITQYKDPKSAKKYIIELINSREIYEILGQEFIPVIPSDKKISITRDDEFLYSFNFNYKYAYADEFYSTFDETQYFNPIIMYRNGIVTNAIQGQIAVLDFEAMINADINVDFEINWGPDVGITTINTALVDGVWKPLQTSIEIPANATLDQQIEITDNIGGRYLIDYTITEAIVLNTDQTILQQIGIELVFAAGSLIAIWGDGANSPFVSGIELTYDYASTDDYKISIIGDLINITEFIADNNRITAINRIKTGLLTSFDVENNLIFGTLDLSNSKISNNFVVKSNSITNIIFASSGNEIVNIFHANSCNLTELDLSNVPINGDFNVSSNANLQSINFAISGNNTIHAFHTELCNLTSLNLSNVPVSFLFYTYQNPNLTSIIFASSGNSIVNNFRAFSCNLTSLDLSNVPISTKLRLGSNPNLASIIFAPSGNGNVSNMNIFECNLTALDLSNVPIS
ncbi:MAG: hypothetical protein GWP19_09120, partial [Planctomycetia bacterium]|nr:hypothetical protein [Planctomycetia bacterium]